MSEEVIRQLVEACDADKDGAISRQDIETTLRRLSGKNQGSRAVFAAADTDGNGMLRYEEFAKVLLRSQTSTTASVEDSADLISGTYFEEKGLLPFFSDMFKLLGKQEPDDPYEWMINYIDKHRHTAPRSTVAKSAAELDRSAATGHTPPFSSTVATKPKSPWRINTSAVLRRTPKKLLDEILQKPCWEQVEQPTDDKCHLYFTWDSKSFLARLGHPSCRSIERVTQLPAGTWTNRLPGMAQLCDKVNMTLALRLLQQLWPEKFRFWPRSWLLPAETEQLKAWMGKHKDKTVIIKPADGSLGEGIFLARDVSDLESKLSAKPQWGAGFAALAQLYLPNPLLIGGLKFDLRLYAVVTSTDPLEAFLCREGLVRFCTVKYEEPNAANACQHYMHLTNFSVNKKSSGFVKATDPFDPTSTATKRTLSTLMQQIAAQEAESGRSFDPQQLFAAFEEIVAVLIQAVAPVLNVTYSRVAKEATAPPKSKAKARPKARVRRRSAQDDSEEDEDSEDEEESDDGSGFQPRCFQLLGIDVLLDENLQPWLLEVNGRPSMDIEEPVRMADAPEGMRRCACRDMDGEEHVHLPSSVDLYIKSVAMVGAFELALSTSSGGAVPPQYSRLDFGRYGPSADLEDTMQLIAQLYQAAGGSQKAFTTYGARRALTGAIKAGLNQHDLDAAVTRWKHQGYRHASDLEQDTAEIGVLDFAALLQEVAMLGKDDEDPLDALSSLLADCDVD
mmetsp:Transcript_37470/g.74309  ORF Transcript_37470/g.74309 Transcript_37470/m.74309 type:complete len:732 (-) Transcript_37470:138-2333(-)